mmetsp:Transcript_17432/g.47641  ORF Transcript_17432/g.47641 Transcript_17432/m.47641 type:complete len:249 (-) Transcript_17432:1852-2598(-)
MRFFNLTSEDREGSRSVDLNGEASEEDRSRDPSLELSCCPVPSPDGSRSTGDPSGGLGAMGGEERRDADTAKCCSPVGKHIGALCDSNGCSTSSGVNVHDIIALRAAERFLGVGLRGVEAALLSEPSDGTERLLGMGVRCATSTATATAGGSACPTEENSCATSEDPEFVVATSGYPAGTATEPFGTLPARFCPTSEPDRAWRLRLPGGLAEGKRDVGGIGSSLGRTGCVTSSEGPAGLLLFRTSSTP